MDFLHFLVYCLPFSLVFGQLGRFPGFGGETRVYIWDVLVFLIVGVWLVEKLLSQSKIKLPRFWFFLLFFNFISFLSLLNGLRWLDMGAGMVSAAYWVRWFVYTFLYFVAADLWQQDSKFKWRLANCFLLSAVLLGLLGFLQLVIFPDLSVLDPNLGWDPHKNRLVSTWLDPNFLGAYFVLCLNLSLARLLSLPERGNKVEQERRTHNSVEVDKISKFIVGIFYFTQDLLFGIWNFLTNSMWGNILCCLVITVALLLTFSRSAWGMMGIVLGFWGIFRLRWLLPIMAALFFSAYFFVPRVQTRLAGITDPADSSQMRIVSWQRTLEIIKDYPVLGVGFNAFRYAQERGGYFRDERGVPIKSGHSGAGSDSSLLLVFATTGVIGLLAYLCLLGSLGWSSFCVFRKNPDRLLSLSFFSGLLGLFAESNFINSLFFSPLLIWLWLFAANGQEEEL
ncbi:MAG: O-antigen ligase family protein [Patescibacteria group bacterium]